MPVRLIIFDLDGTLVDSSVDITNALNYAVEPYGIRPLKVEDTIKMVGEGISRLIEKLIAGSFTGSVAGLEPGSMKDALTERFIEHYTAHIIDYTRAYPGVRETLEGLSGYKKAVISNKREALSKKTLEGLELMRFFNYVVGSDTTPEKKPSPVPVLKVLNELSVIPEEAVMVGDSNYDVDAGKAAGVTTVAVTYGYKPVEMIRHADYMIDRMGGLSELLERINSMSGQ